jgi:hypothetical protein
MGTTTEQSGDLTLNYDSASFGPTVREWPNRPAKTGFQNLLGSIFEFDWFLIKTIAM